MVLMSLSLVGIIFVQGYYINNTVKHEEEQFNFNVKSVLNYTSNAIEKREVGDYNRMLQEHIAKGGIVDTTSIRNLYIIDDSNESETFIYRNGILEENWKIPSFFDISLDSISITRLQSRRESAIIKKNNLEVSGLSPEAILAKTQEITESQQLQIETAYRDLAKRTPIHKRTTRREIEDLLDRKFSENGIDIAYEYAIYAKDLATKIQSDNFLFS
jgi:two-component system phosphate regulon sensor histidine kinase PhoR